VRLILTLQANVHNERGSDVSVADPCRYRARLSLSGLESPAAELRDIYTVSRGIMEAWKVPRIEKTKPRKTETLAPCLGLAVHKLRDPMNTV
jgi:hypothetical protein